MARGQQYPAVHDDEPSPSDKLDRNGRRAEILRPMCGLELELELELKLELELELELEQELELELDL